MDTFFKFLYDFLSVFFKGLIYIFKGLITGIVQMFNFSGYRDVVMFYKDDLKGSEWVFVIISIIILVVLFALFVLLIVFIVRKWFSIRGKALKEEEMLEEVASLNRQVLELSKKNDEIMAMKVSQLGLAPGEVNNTNNITSNTTSITNNSQNSTTTSNSENTTVGGAEGEDEESVEDLENIRFSKLHRVDVAYRNYKVQNYGNTFTLPELVEIFRNFAASKLHLYYSTDMMRLFISAIASTRLIILQGISGTGKTSLAYAWGKFIRKDAIIASVQPSWRDRTELFGYFNEFTKKFNETDVLMKMYEAGYNDDVYVVVLDEMNISRVEYYFAEMLSILEMPSHDEWIIEIVQSSWPNDPKKLVGGKLRIPDNMWYIGTINNDDSTFAVTDKVYDRAMPIDINDKGQPFEPIPTDSMNINASYLQGKFDEAIAKNPISQSTLDKVAEMDDYVIKHFRIAFGNRIVKHMNLFVPVYVECGGDEIDGVDYFIARKILRKFEQLNLSYIRDEIDGFIEFLDEKFGPDKFTECKDYLLRLKKMG